VINEYTKHKIRGLSSTPALTKTNIVHHSVSYRPPKLTSPEKGGHEWHEKFAHGLGPAHQSLNSK